MTDSQISFYGTRGASFTMTDVSDSWTEATDATNSLSLDDTLLGETITGYSGSKGAAGGFFAIYNTVRQQYKMLGALDVLTEEGYHTFDWPVKIEDKDIVQIFSVAAPT